MTIDPYQNVRFDVVESLQLDDLTGALADCFTFWQDICGACRMPAWRDVDMSEMPPTLPPHVAVIDVDWSAGEHITADRLRYRYWGTKQVEMKKVERTGTRVSEHHNRTDLVMAEYQAVIDERRPMAFQKNIRVADPFHAAFQRTVRLPLSNDGERVDNIMIASNWEPLKPQLGRGWP